MRSASGVWYSRPPRGRAPATVPPVDTSIRSAPAAASRRAISTASPGVVPPAAQSLAEMRTDSGRSAGQTARTASTTSHG